MQLLGIGIDVVEVSRIENSIAEFGQKFLDRIFTSQEQDYCQKQKRGAIHYAARFAAKEAISKAFGTGIGKDVGWLDLEVLRKASGEPEIHLHGRAKDFAAQKKVADIKISLTHAEHYAAANAVILVREGE